MDRREALAALAAIPGLKKIERTDLAFGDVLVLTVAHMMTDEEIADLKRRLEEVFPGHRCLVLTEDATLKVMRPGEVT